MSNESSTFPYQQPWVWGPDGPRKYEPSALDASKSAPILLPYLPPELRAEIDTLTARLAALEKASVPAVPAVPDVTEPDAPLEKPARTFAAGDRGYSLSRKMFGTVTQLSESGMYRFVFDDGKIWWFLANAIIPAAEAPVPDPQAAKGSGMSPEYYCEWVRENFAASPPYRCGACSNLLWKMLTLSGYKAERRTGEVQGIGHVWVNCEGKILDPTDAQFSEPIKYPHGELFVDDPPAAKGPRLPQTPEELETLFIRAYIMYYAGTAEAICAGHADDGPRKCLSPESARAAVRRCLARPGLWLGK